MFCDTCVPIETGHISLSVLYALSFYPGSFSQNWRTVTAGGNYHTFYMPVKLTYGPTKNLEMYLIAPFITNWASECQCHPVPMAKLPPVTAASAT